MLAHAPSSHQVTGDNYMDCIITHSLTLNDFLVASFDNLTTINYSYYPMYMMTSSHENALRIAGPLWGESIRDR